MEQEVGEFVRAEHADGLSRDPTVNASVLLRGAIRLALSTKDANRRSHLSEDPLPQLTKVAKQTARALWLEDLPYDGPGDGDAWTPGEVKELLVKARLTDPRVHEVCLFQYLTGARIGECLALPWSDVELGNRLLTFRRKIYRGKIGNLKTKNSKRTIELPGRLVEHLQDIRKQRPRSEYLFPHPGKPKRPWNDDAYQKAWRKVRNATDVRPLGTHAWRHAHISLALADGKDPAWIAQRCGTSIEMIFRRYGHAIKRTGRESFDYLTLD